MQLLKEEIGVALIYDFCCKVLAELQLLVVALLYRCLHLQVWLTVFTYCDLQSLHTVICESLHSTSDVCSVRFIMHAMSTKGPRQACQLVKSLLAQPAHSTCMETLAHVCTASKQNELAGRCSCNGTADVASAQICQDQSRASSAASRMT